MTRIYCNESEIGMLTLQIDDRVLEKQFTELLQQKFNGDTEKMLEELIRVYRAQLNRLKYSGILKWNQDGLTFTDFQKIANLELISDIST